MDRKLIFRFGDQLQLSFDQSRFAPGDMIKFGQGFDDMQVIFQGPTPSEARALEKRPQSSNKPVMEISMPQRGQSSSDSTRKRAADVSPKHTAPRPSVFTRLTYPKAPRAQRDQPLLDQPVEKDVAMVVHDQPVQPVVLSQPTLSGNPNTFLSHPSQYEVGTSSATVLTKTQRRNKNRRIKKRMEREEKQKALQDVEMHDTSPLLEGSRFHALSAVGGEENIKKIARSPPKTPPIAFKNMTPEQKTKQWEHDIRGVFRRVAGSTNTTKEGVINAMKGMISKKVAAVILEDDKTPENGTILVQPSRKDSEKYATQPAVSALVDGYKVKEMPRKARSEEILLVDNSQSDIPTRFRRLSEEDKSSTPSEELHLRGHTQTSSTDEGGLGQAPNLPSSSGVKKVWRPKAVVLSPQHSLNISPSVPKSKRKEPVEEDSYEEYAPEPLNPQQFANKSMTEVVEELRATFRERDELERKRYGDDDMDFDMDDDDLMDEEEVLTVNTRRTPHQDESQGDQIVDEEEVEERENDPLIQQLLEQLKSKDVYIQKIEKRMDEMTAAMKALTAQLSTIPKVSVVDKPSTSAEHRSKAIQIEDDARSQTSRDSEFDQQPSSKDDLKEYISQQIKESMAQTQGDASIQKGRPYPEDFDLVQYPKGFVPPTFKLFDGVGNPRQHLAHFRAGCCNVGGNDALLFRQFVSSLSGVAFDWYAELPNGSVKTFAELETLFIKRFAGAQHHITVGDLVVEKQKPNESLVDYILRWRNLSMKCEPQLQEQHAIEILLRNIHGPIALILKGFTIRTFEKLLSKASNLQSESGQLAFLKEQNINEQAKKLKQKAVDKKQGSVSTLSLDKSRPIHIMEENPKSEKGQKKPDFRGLSEKINQQYSFKRDAISKIFKSLMKNDNFQLPRAKKPDEVDKFNQPNYCPYHRMLGHVIEDCYVFKDWVENEYKTGKMNLPKAYLMDPGQGSAKVISGELSLPTSEYVLGKPVTVQSAAVSSKKDNASSILIDSEGWQFALSRSSIKMLNKLPQTPLEMSLETHRSLPKALVQVSSDNSMVGLSPKPTKLHKKVVPMVKEKEKEKSHLILSSDGKGKSLKPLTLSDFMYVPDSSNAMKNPSAYVLSVHSDNDEQNQNENINNETSQSSESNGSTSDSDLPVFNLQGAKFTIEDESSDSDQVIESKQNTLSEVLVDVTTTSEPEQITEIKLRSGRVLPPQMASNKNKEKQPMNQNLGATPPTSSLSQEQVGGGPPKVDYNVLAHLRKLPARLSIYDALVLSSEMRESLIKALLDPEICLAQLAEGSSGEAHYFKEVPGVTFSNEDLLLGTSDHNRPLYITIIIDDFKLNRVLVDPGASVNIMNLRTLAYLNVDTQKLSSDRMMLRGFNEKGERALGSVTLSILIGDLRTEAKFHVIDSETAFKALLGRPWLHEYRMVPSSLHQCIKYERNGVEYIIKGDLQPFGIHEVGIYEDAAYYVPKSQDVFSKMINTTKVQAQPKDTKVESRSKEKQSDDEELEDLVIWHPSTPPTQRGGRMAQRARGRDRVAGRGRGQNDRKVRDANPKISPPSSSKQRSIIDLESNMEDESDVMDLSSKRNNNNKTQISKWKWDIKEETDSDEDIVYYKKDVSELTTFDRLNEFVKTLTPLSESTVAGLNVSVVPKLRDEVEKDRVFHATVMSPGLEDDVKLEDLSLNEMVELPFDG